MQSRRSKLGSITALARGATRFAIIPALPLWVFCFANAIVSALESPHPASASRLEALLWTGAFIPFASLPGYLLAAHLCGSSTIHNSRFAIVSSVAGWFSLLLGLLLVLGPGDGSKHPSLFLVGTPLIGFGVSWSLIRIALRPIRGWLTFKGPGVCCHCGYPLRVGGVAQVCPECGASPP